MPHRLISRRALLVSSGAALGCGRRKATGFPGYCLVANQQGRSVAAVDLNTFRVRKIIGLPSAPAAIAAHPDAARPKAYVLTPDSGSVHEIDAGRLAAARAVRLAGQAVSMQLSPGKDAFWVLTRDPAALVLLPLEDFRPARRIALPAPPDSFDISMDGRAAVASGQSRTITTVSLSKGVIERTLSFGSVPSMICFRSDGKQVIAGSAPDRNLVIIDAVAGKPVVRLPLPLAPRHFCFNADGGQLFVTGDGMDAVVIAFPYNTEIDQTVLAGRAPGAMAATDTSPAYLLVANPDDNAVTVLDIDTRRLVAVVRVGQAPGGIVVMPDRQYALVLNRNSGDMAVIRRQMLTETWVRRYKSAPLFTMIPVGEQPVAAAVVRVG